MPPAATAADREALRASIARDSLVDFIREAWPIVEPGHPLIWGWHLDAICEYLEAVTAGEITRLLMNVPPRHTKSLTTSVFWPAWEWLRKPELRYLTVSHSGDHAVRDAYQTRRLMQSEGLQLAPADLEIINHGETATLLQAIGYQGLLSIIGNEWLFSDAQNLKSRYENDATGRRVSTSIGGGATGEGGDRVIIDDPHKLEEWDSEAKRREAIQFCTEVAPSRLNTSEAAIVMIMQRVHEADATAAVLGRVEDVEGWGDIVHLCLPEQYEPKHPFTWPDDPRIEPGELLWPERFDERAVAEHKLIGSMKYAGNYQQRPSPAEGDVFLRTNWMHYGAGGDREEPPRTWQAIAHSWDATFGESDNPSSSYVCGQVWGKDGADAYLLAMIRARMSFPEMKRAVPALLAFAGTIAARNQAGGTGAIVIEKAAAGKPLLEELRRVVPALKGKSPTTSKLTRALAVQPYHEAQNLWLPRGVIPAPPGYEPTPTSAFVEEAANFPAAAHDDMIDTMSQGIEELYHARVDEASSHAAAGEIREPVVERHGIRKVGEKYVDREPGK